MTFIETLVLLAIVGTIAVTFLSGLFAMSKAATINDEQITAGSLAQSQMEWVKKADYVPGATDYPALPMPGGSDYSRYSVTIAAQQLDTGIQKITVVVRNSDKTVIRLEDYKVDR